MSWLLSWVCHDVGGTFSFAGGEWIDGKRSPICEACPQLDPSVVVCEGDSVKSQPGYSAQYSSERSRRASRYTVVTLHECPNRAACKYEGLLDSVCNATLPVCNARGDGGTCDEGYTGAATPPHCDFDFYRLPL